MTAAETPGEGASAVGSGALFRQVLSRADGSVSGAVISEGCSPETARAREAAWPESEGWKVETTETTEPADEPAEDADPSEAPREPLRSVRLVVVGADLESPDVLEAVGKSDLVMALWHSVAGIRLATVFPSPGETLESAACAFARTLAAVLPGARALRAQSDRVSRSDVCRLTGLSYESVAILTKRDGFPKTAPGSVVKSKGPELLWEWGDVSAWLASELRWSRDDCPATSADIQRVDRALGDFYSVRRAGAAG